MTDQPEASASTQGKPSRGGRIAFWAGPIAAVAIWAVTWLAGLEDDAAKTAGITALCAVWWIFEPIAIPATSLLPFALFPLFGVLDNKSVAQAYGDKMILLLLGGFMLSVAMERSKTHLRLALGMLRFFGNTERRLVLGFMVASAFCSMWISNSATTLMLLPIAMAVLRQARSQLAIPLLLGMAYAASIGGVGTLVGTPPNVIFAGVYENEFGDSDRFGFASWMAIGIPVVVLMLPLLWLWLTRSLRGGGQRIDVPHPGAWRPAERRVLIVFACTAAAWIFLTQPNGGWSRQWMESVMGKALPPGSGSGIGSDTVALIAVGVLFVVPDGEGGRLLDWEWAKRIPWGLLLLFGGGLAIARAFNASGLSDSLGSVLAGVATWPRWALVLTICLFVTFLTEVTSNTATTSLLMPILAAAGKTAQIDPAILMVPAALSASCAFMLPVATAPNAIVFGSSLVTTRDMVRNGFVLNLMGAVVITAVCLVML